MERYWQIKIFRQHKHLQFRNFLISPFQLERTPLHYAMGLESVEELSSILIKAGAKRVVKDLVSLTLIFRTK